MHNSYASKQQQKLEPEKKGKKTKIQRQAKILIKFRNIDKLCIRD